MNFNEQGIQAMSEKKYEEAAQAFTKAIEEDKTNPTGYINFGNLLGSLGDLERALAFFDKAIEKKQRRRITELARFILKKTNLNKQRKCSNKHLLMD